MRHRSDTDENTQARTARRSPGRTTQTRPAQTRTAQATRPTEPSRLLSLGELIAGQPAAEPSPVQGKHRATIDQIPTQLQPSHDNVAQQQAQQQAPAPARPTSVPQQRTEPAPAAQVPAIKPLPAPRVQPRVKAAPQPIPHEAQWRASHLPRLVAATLLVLAIVGTAGLGLRYAQTALLGQLLVPGDRFRRRGGPLGPASSSARRRWSA